MAKEIEKKYLLKGTILFPQGTKYSLITQGYIHVDRNKQIRVRKIVDMKGISYMFCIKYMTEVRDEYEMEISKRMGEDLLNKCKNKFIKSRHSYTQGRLHFDFDKYDNGVKICEIEFPSLNDVQTAILPSFIGKCVDGVHEYCNYFFAGIPEKQYR